MASCNSDGSTGPPTACTVRTTVVPQVSHFSVRVTESTGVIIPGRWVSIPASGDAVAGDGPVATGYGGHVRIGRWRLQVNRRRPTGIAPFVTVGTSMTDDEYDEWYAQVAWDPNRYPGLTIEHELTPAAWIEQLLVPGSFHVEMTVPRGYEAYARIFFPFSRSAVDAEGEWHEERVTWTDMATENGKVVHALMEHETITPPTVGNEAGPQCWSMPDPVQVEVMLPVLARHTSSTEGWFLLWDGFGNLNRDVLSDAVPKVGHPHRDFFLLHGPLDTYANFVDVPNYWWPDDRAWCLSSETDFFWSYLAGSRACVDEILAIPAMDAVETALENPAHQGMDTVNDPGGEIRRSY